MIDRRGPDDIDLPPAALRHGKADPPPGIGQLLRNRFGIGIEIIQLDRRARKRLPVV